MNTPSETLWRSHADRASMPISVSVCIEDLQRRYDGLTGESLLRPMIEREFVGRLAVVSSFGTEAAVMLSLIASIDRCTPILFLDTGRLFSETLLYRDRLVDLLGLRDVRTLTPHGSRISHEDSEGMLWMENPDACCTLRKVEPLETALADFTAWVSGRKQYHGAARSALPVFEKDALGRIKINPLATWSREQIGAEFIARKLPRHPLEAEGYLSVGCLTCTDRVHAGEDLRAGRWRHISKTECGIHLVNPVAST